jgi:hypothetical protein
MRPLWEALKALAGWVVSAPVRFVYALARLTDLAPWFTSALSTRHNPRHKEAWGYIWWGAAGIVIAVPELWAAVGGKDVLWPTISGTIGNLEISHVWVALVVAGVLVWGAVHAVRVTKEKLREAAVEAGATGPTVDPAIVGTGATLVEDVDRFTVAESTEDIAGLQYLLFAVAAVALPSVLVHELAQGDDHRYVFGETMYASIAFWWLIVPGWLAYKRGALVPYPTLFRTLKDLAGRTPQVTFLLIAGLVVLLVHLILYPWPSTIPDTNRLHLQYKCHPLQPRSAPLDDDQKQACQKLDDADLRPPADSP